MEQFLDISGSCHIVRGAKWSNNWRPSISKPIARVLGVDYEEWKCVAILRVLYFLENPHVDRNYCLSNSCGDYRCANVSHARLGVINPRRAAKVSM